MSSFVEQHGAAEGTRTFNYDGATGQGQAYQALADQLGVENAQYGDGRVMAAIQKKMEEDGTDTFNVNLGGGAPPPPPPQYQQQHAVVQMGGHGQGGGSGQFQGNFQGQFQSRSQATYQSNTQYQATTHTTQYPVSGQGQDKSNKIRINLHSQNQEGDFDNMASVEVECDNPDAVIHRMLDKLADKFPPESVVTIEKDTAEQTGHVKEVSVHASLDRSQVQERSMEFSGSKQQPPPQAHQITVRRQETPNEGPPRQMDFSRVPQQQQPRQIQISRPMPPQPQQQPRQIHIQQQPQQQQQPRQIQIQRQITPTQQQPRQIQIQHQPQQQQRQIQIQAQPQQPPPKTISIERSVPQPPPVEVETRPMYVEMPVQEEVEVFVPKKEIRYVEKHVPKIVTEVREIIEEVPEIRYNDVYEEVAEYQEVIKHVPVKQIVDKHVETVRYVPKVEVRTIEKVVEVPARDGRVVEVPKPYKVEQRETVAVFKDTLVPCVVSQKLMPIIQNSLDEIEVEAKKYVPYLVPVDVYVPRPVEVPLIPLTRNAAVDHTPVQVPSAQFNSLLLDINPHLRDEKEKFLPTIRAPNGTIPLMPGAEAMTLDFELQKSQLENLQMRIGDGQFAKQWDGQPVNVKQWQEAGGPPATVTIGTA